MYQNNGSELLEIEGRPLIRIPSWLPRCHAQEPQRRRAIIECGSTIQSQSRRRVFSHMKWSYLLAAQLSSGPHCSVRVELDRWPRCSRIRPAMHNSELQGHWKRLPKIVMVSPTTCDVNVGFPNFDDRCDCFARRDAQESPSKRAVLGRKSTG